VALILVVCYESHGWVRSRAGLLSLFVNMSRTDGRVRFLMQTTDDSNGLFLSAAHLCCSRVAKMSS
jgi:hypothetical protein